MSTKRQASNKIWSTLVRILIFIIALYLAYIILKPLLSLFLGVGFWLIKILVFIAAAFIVVHLFLKLIFQVDLMRTIFGRSWRR